MHLNHNISRLSLLLLLAVTSFVLSGCAIMRTTETANGVKKTTTVCAFINKSAITGFASHKSTKTTSSQLSISDANTETQADALEALVKGAVEGALKGVKP